MLFNSVEYIIFLPFVFFVYWAIRNQVQYQNLFLLLVSYFFYGWWDWRFLGLIAFSSIVDFIVGKSIFQAESKTKRKIFLSISICVNLGILGFFKYYNFFIDSWVEAMSIFGIKQSVSTLNIILPAGISFYTFQTMSYTIDIYNKKLKPINNLIVFFAFVSFFPQLVAGPIERAKNLLPQFLATKIFDTNRVKDGLRQILWGLFKKVAIADNCAPHVENIYSNFASLSSTEILIGVILFSFQIYADFSGYSDIAIGSARLLGFDLMKNFSYPYFAKSVGEFWQRWHISLSTWFRDYLYIPIGGSRVSKLQYSRNIIITFVVSGFWHGANWTFLFWGFLNGLYYLPSIFIKRKKIKFLENRKLFLKIFSYSRILLIFLITSLTWIFFRSPNIYDAFGLLKCLFSFNFFPFDFVQYFIVFIFISIMVIAEIIQVKKDHPIQIQDYPLGIRWAIYLGLSIISLEYLYGDSTFLYFQF